MKLDNICRIGLRVSASADALTSAPLCAICFAVSSRRDSTRSVSEFIHVCAFFFLSGIYIL